MRVAEKQNNKKIRKREILLLFKLIKFWRSNIFLFVIRLQTCYKNLKKFFNKEFVNKVC